jgi:hypothetical protein
MSQISRFRLSAMNRRVIHREGGAFIVNPSASPKLPIVGEFR